MTANYTHIQIQQFVAENLGMSSIEDAINHNCGVFGRDLLFDKNGCYYGMISDNALSRAFPPHVEKVTLFKGGAVFKTIFGDEVACPIYFKVEPTTSFIWAGKGYSGGHVSQAYWDDSQEEKAMVSFLKEGFFVKDLTSKGNTAGYYPKIAYWK